MLKIGDKVKIKPSPNTKKGVTQLWKHIVGKTGRISEIKSRKNNTLYYGLSDYEDYRMGFIYFLESELEIIKE